MKNALITILAAILLASCCFSGPSYPAPEVIVPQIQRMTIALVDSSVNPRPYCAGVWVAQRQFITAAHCAEGKPNTLYLTAADVQGKADGFTSAPKREAFLVYAHLTYDLALYHTLNDPDPHPVAQIAPEIPPTGAPAHAMGHTKGYCWNYSPGPVSQLRNMNGPDRVPGRWLHINAAVWFGNSGGGAFDGHGRLLGIASFISTDAPNLAFFVPADIVEKFLHPKDETK